jgi:hypothetical protein
VNRGISGGGLWLVIVEGVVAVAVELAERGLVWADWRRKEGEGDAESCGRYEWSSSLWSSGLLS